MFFELYFQPKELVNSQEALERQKEEAQTLPNYVEAVSIFEASQKLSKLNLTYYMLVCIKAHSSPINILR